MYMSPITADGSIASPVMNEPTRLRLRLHQKSVSVLSKAVASALGLDEFQCLRIGRAAAWHDVGKLYISNEILNDSHPINERDFLDLKKHTIYGHNHLKVFKGDPVAELASEIALQHHEKWDGTGYPFGLSREEISIESRIVAICDVYDALREDRPYRNAISHDDAMHVLIRGDMRTNPSMFDPKVLQAVTRIDDKFRDIFEEQHRRDGRESGGGR
ncbi:HD-GYP domain-containing protein [Novosphingobium sp. Fuku2-ISO-50]|uniref:HD-GYP domain-containing protein n=1 Tax=Novosphingobium sp. Fuku2-ISO-50 TaxID=1739114 RepID=UPI0009E66EA6|nr:HD domain-containing phosphohydrolase [Novosphingobium sp. Fuku2-ISO-50]